MALVEELSDLLDGVVPAGGRCAMTTSCSSRSASTTGGSSPAPSGLLGELNAAGVLEASDVHVAPRLGDLAGETDERVLLAVALAVRAVRHGSVCVDLATVPGARARAAPGRSHDAWSAAVAASPLVEQGVVRLEHDLLYLDRYHRLERQVCDDLLDRTAQPPPEVDEPALDAPPSSGSTSASISAEQRPRRPQRAVRQWTTVITGGPGTGKTTTVARLLALLADQADHRGERLSVALSRPDRQGRRPAPGGGRDRAGRPARPRTGTGSAGSRR